ncbi:unnamed protein product [Anisakis simplex]|uniref:dTDP-D-glucose 4,6-dehydratase (inferred by orthology to a human protein) n=1 Tax=Anisakis simplex TaxID=6269 RepID=A0A158PNZ7_ANISI|nr:unnamed protein product [Anisakis simplex]
MESEQRADKGKEYKPRNVLVTGGCGFIGSNFMNYIFGAWPRARFVNYDKLILNSDSCYVREEIRNNTKRYQLVTADLRNRDVMRRVLSDNEIDTVIHFAADCTSTRCYSDPIESIQNNVLSYVDFLDEVKDYGKTERFIHISTDEVYGDSDLSSNEKGKLEDAMLRPGNPYAATKVACEYYAHAYREQYRIPIIILRINNIYGPNQWDVKVVPRFIEVAKKQEKYTIQGSGEQLRSWLYVDDAAAGIQMATELGEIGQIYNLGTYFEMNVLDLAHKIQSEVDKQMGRKQPTPVEFISIPDRPYNDLRYLIDITKAKDQLGWSPKISFDEGIRRVVASTLCERKETQKMNVIIYGGNGWVGKQMQKLMTQRKIHFQVAECKVGRNTDEEVLAELVKLCGTHVLCCTGRTHGGEFKTIEYLEGGPEKTEENVRDNLCSAVTLAYLCEKLGLHYTYVGTGYLFAYDKEHTIGGKGFTEQDTPTFFGNSYSVVKGYTDRLMSQYQGGIKECLNARITLPLNFALNEERNLLTKIIKYKFVLLFHLFDHYSLQLVDRTLPDYEVIDVHSEKGRAMCAKKGNCALETSLLQRLCPYVLSSSDALRKGFEQMKNATAT